MSSVNRIEKVNSLLLQEIGKIIQRDFEFSPNILVTLTRVDASSNLIEAKVFTSVFPDNQAVIVVCKLNRAIYVIQKKIDKILNMRPIPKIKFVIDKNPRTAGRVEELLARLDARQAELKNQEK